MRPPRGSRISASPPRWARSSSRRPPRPSGKVSCSTTRLRPRAFANGRSTAMPDSTVLMDEEPLLGRVRLFHDLGDDRWAIESRYDLEPTLEANQVSRTAWPGHYRGSPELGMTLAARLPMPIWTHLRTSGIL